MIRLEKVGFNALEKGCFKWLKVASAVLWMLGMIGMVSNGVMVNIYGLLCESVREGTM